MERSACLDFRYRYVYPWDADHWLNDQAGDRLETLTSLDQTDLSVVELGSAAINLAPIRDHTRCLPRELVPTRGLSSFYRPTADGHTGGGTNWCTQLPRASA